MPESCHIIIKQEELSILELDICFSGLFSKKDNLILTISLELKENMDWNYTLQFQELRNRGWW